MMHMSGLLTLSTALKESKHVYISISCNGSHLTFAKDPVRNYLPLRNISSYPDKPAMIDVSSGETLTFSQLKSMVAKVSHGLSRLGVSKGDVLLIVAPNLIHFLCAFGYCSSRSHCVYLYRE
ncbi:hypothetical protein Dimus_030044 [Dionaea muscipula]